MIAQIKNSGLFTATTPAPTVNAPEVAPVEPVVDVTATTPAPTAPADGYKQAPVPAKPVPVEQLPVKP